MEWSDVLSETNILIFYTRKSVLRVQSYGTMNMGIWNMEISGT